MNERFGPWSSALGDGLSPHLGTFWKRRLALLASARSARLGLSRRDWLKLGAAGAAACALPTLHLASADDPKDVKPVASGKIYVYADLKTGKGDDDSVSGVFAIDPETGTYDKVYDLGGEVRISRDGRRLALDETGVWTLNADGKGEKRRVANFGGLISWSSDGEQLIVTKSEWLPNHEMLRHENWRFNADGSGATRLPIPETEEVDDWSPDGRWLVTTSDRHPPHGRGYQLYLMRPDGSDQRRLTEGKGLNVYPRFSPDGRRIAYLHGESGKAGIWIVDVDGSNRHRVVGETDDRSPDHFLSWSPDGKSLAYMTRYMKQNEKRGHWSLDAVEIAIVDVEGKNRRILKRLPARWIGRPDWR